MTGYVPLNFKAKLASFEDYWSPRVIAEMNDYQFKLATVEGEFVWHDHKDTDEVFIVIEGRLKIEFRDGAVELSAGEMFVVPRGVEHKPVAEQECHLLLIEPRGVRNTGDAGGALTAEGDVWI
ncbi:MAG: cupin domain-containing protein [Gammaproteobacteria bacterium]|nr:MAG: cupin domain-containing protein [Gammaproteobacteria bacterium]